MSTVQLLMPYGQSKPEKQVNWNGSCLTTTEIKTVVMLKHFFLQSTQFFKNYNKTNTCQNQSGEFRVCINSNQPVSHFDCLFSYRKFFLEVVYMYDANTKLSLTPPAYLSSDGPFDLDLFLRPLWPASITGWVGPWLAVVGCSQLKKLTWHQNNTTFC